MEEITVNEEGLLKVAEMLSLLEIELLEASGVVSQKQIREFCDDELEEALGMEKKQEFMKALGNGVAFVVILAKRIGVMKTCLLNHNWPVALVVLEEIIKSVRQIKISLGSDEVILREFTEGLEKIQDDILEFMPAPSS